MSEELGCQCINGVSVFAEERPEKELSQIWDQSDLQQNSLSFSNFPKLKSLRKDEQEDNRGQWSALGLEENETWKRL